MANCPWCGGELTKGNVSAPPNTFEFYPAGVKPAMLRSRWEKTEGAVTIMEFEMFRKGSSRGYFCPAEYCSVCKKVILSLSEDEVSRSL